MLPAVEASSQPAAALTRRGINMTQCVARGVRRPVGERQGSDSRSPGTPACRAPASRCHFPMPCCPPPAIFASLEACDSRQRDTSVAAPTCVGASLLSARFYPAPQADLSRSFTSEHTWRVGALLAASGIASTMESVFWAWRRKAGPSAVCCIASEQGHRFLGCQPSIEGQQSSVGCHLSGTCQTPPRHL